MTTKNLVWWTGVVEDRDDPQKLGRCRVRVFGYHHYDTKILPTKELPWAIPMQPITSAATSGVGTTPVGIVTGTWVMGFFLDGEEAQHPVIMGTIAGKPNTNTDTANKIVQAETNKNVVKDSYGNTVYDQGGNPLNSSVVVLNERDTLKPLNSTKLSLLFDAIANKLSAMDSTKIGDKGEIGKYQMPISTLVDLGYILRPAGGLITADLADDEANWTGKNGIRSKEGLVNSEALQETIMFEYTKSNYATMTRLGKITEDDDVAVVGGLLASAHIMGAKNADKLDKKDSSGQKAQDFFVLGNSSLGGDATEFLRTYQEAGNYLPKTATLNNEDLAKIIGFQDPNKKYPKYEYAGLSDINKLAIGDRSHLIFQIKENRKIESIPLARTEQTWDEPEPAYGGHYPYNQVIETEAGHVIEIDSTPNAERIQVFHKKGTYIEIDVNGSMVRKTVGENYEIMDRNNFVYVKGAHNLTVEGKTSILVRDNATIEVEGDLSVTGHGDTLVQSAGVMAVVAESAIVTAKKSMEIVTEGSLDLQGKDINLHSVGGAITIKSDRDLSLQSGNSYTLSLKGGISMLLDALSVKTKMGANTIKALTLSILNPPKKMQPDVTQIPVLQRRALNDDSFILDGGESGAQDYAKQRAENGEISNNIQLQPDPADVAKGNTRSLGPSTITPVGCEICDKFNNSFPRSFNLSKNFTLGHVLIGKYGPALVAQRGLQEKDIVCNLIQLAENCLEPIKKKYPDMVISSGFRIGTSTSDHGIGAAVDIVWPNRKLSDIKDIAEWITTNVPHRQCLLEYETYEGTDKIRVAWVHISFLTSNGRLVQSSFPPVQTFVNHQSKYSKLVNMA